MSLPLLPPLAEALVEQAVTHRSFCAPRPGAVNTDNEKLAFLGQGVLSACVSKIVYDTFSTQSAKVLNSIKSKFLNTQKNHLADYAVEYQLINHIRCAESSRKGLETSVDFRASIMEAYIGALAMENGLDSVTRWLHELLGSTIRSLGTPFVPPPGLTPIQARTLSVSSVRSGDSRAGDLPNAPYTVGALAKFNENAAQRYQRPEWSFESQGQGQDIQWTARLKINGVLVGEGIGQNKQISKEVAANHALKHLKWVVKES